MVQCCSAWAQAKTKSFGQKQNTKVTFNTTTTITHPPPPKIFQKVLSLIGGQDLLCRLYIVQVTRPQNFDLPPFKFLWTQNFVGPKTLLDSKFSRLKFFFDQKFFFEPNLFWSNIIFGSKKICIQNFFLPTFFGPNLFGPTFLLTQNLFWT